MKKSVLLAIAFFILLLAMVPSIARPAFAAAKCKNPYTVKTNDTLNGIAEQFNVDVLEFAKYNSIYKDAVKFNNRRSIYVGQTFCVPEGALPWNAKKIQTWASWPAADLRGYIDGSRLIIKGWNFNYQTSFFLKMPGVPKQNLKVKYRVFQVAVNVPKKTADKLVFCLKDITTDANICRTAARIR